LAYNLINIERCPICGSTEYDVVFRKDNFAGQKCGECKVIYLNPRIGDLDEVYTDDTTSSTSKYYRYAVESDRRVFQKRLKMIEEFAGKDSFLDIGCSVGTFLEVAKESGWKNVWGVEPNPEAARIGAEKGLTIINDFFRADLFKYGQRFDAIYFGDVIEHLPDPVKTLEEIGAVLKEEGVVMIVTPNFESIIARMLQIKPYEHILYFTKESITNLLKRSGFRIRKICTTTRERSIEAMAYSTTFTSGKGRKLVKAAAVLHLGGLINVFLELFVRDEILVIAEKV